MKPLQLLLMALWFVSHALGVEITPAPSGGTTMLGAGSLERFHVIGARPGLATAALTDLTAQPLPRVWKLETIQQPADPWKFQLQAAGETAVTRGDTLWARFLLRCSASRNETGEGQMTFVFESADSQHVKSIDITVGAGSEWREFCFPFSARSTLAAGGSQISLRAGFRPQTIEIGGIEVINYGPDRKLESLPRTGFDYPGRQPDASWRQAAAQRIESIRKCDFNLKIVDSSGRPVPDTKVELNLLRHDFGFGSAIDSNVLLGSGADSKRYREVIDRNFSRVVFENELKWHSWERADKQTRDRTLTSFDWFQQRGIAMRGHVLLWPSWQYLPTSVSKARTNPAEVREMIRGRITEMMTLTRGRFHDWDVINEPYAHHDLMDLLGDAAMVDWFQQARAIDPDAVLFLNDYAGLAAGGMNTRHKDHFEKTARFLKEQGAPIGGIGLQCHFGWSVTPPELALQELDRWGALGLEIQLTEFDIDTSDESLQADYTRDLLTLAFSHPSVTAIMAWGFWEGRHWRPDAAMWRKDWTLKPNGKAWLDLTTREWWTRPSGVTGQNGDFATRGFYGNYEISIISNGTKIRKTVDFTKLSRQATVALP